MDGPSVGRSSPLILSLYELCTFYEWMVSQTSWNLPLHTGINPLLACVGVATSRPWGQVISPASMFLYLFSTAHYQVHLGWAST